MCRGPDVFDFAQAQRKVNIKIRQIFGPEVEILCLRYEQSQQKNILNHHTGMVSLLNIVPN